LFEAADFYFDSSLFGLIGVELALLLDMTRCLMGVEAFEILTRGLDCSLFLRFKGPCMFIWAWFVCLYSYFLKYNRWAVVYQVKMFTSNKSKFYD
jgi:hypothetical protein